MTTSSKSVFWELRQSWWILLTFIFMMNTFAFLYIAIRSRSWRWGIWAFIYAAPLFLIFTLDSDSSAFGFGVVLFLMAWFGSVIHAFTIRKKYLIRLEHVLELKRQENEVYRKKLNEDRLRSRIGRAVPQQTGKNHGATRQSGVARPSHPPVHTTRNANFVDRATWMVNLNTASADQLAKLPGVNIIMANKAILHRDRQGAFRSLQQFVDAVDLKPEYIPFVRPFIES